MSAKETYVTKKDCEEYIEQSDPSKALDVLSKKEKESLIEKSRAIIDKYARFTISSLLQEVRYGLGLDEMPEGIDEDEDLPIFDEINKLYMEAFKGCYFCNPWADMNDTTIEVCPVCQMKIVKFLTICGVDTSKIPVLADVPVPEQRHKTSVKKTL